MNWNSVSFGTAVAVLSVSAQAQITYTHPPSRIEWPDGADGLAATRIETGQLTPDGVEDAIMLLGDQVWLLHAPATTPSWQLVATGCSDFAVLPPGPEGRSEVVVSRSNGLWWCKWSSAAKQLLPAVNVAADQWCNAQHLSACQAESPNKAAIAAADANGEVLLLGYLADTGLTTELSCSTGKFLLDVVALDFLPPAAGSPSIEVAYATDSEIVIVDATGDAISGPHSVLSGFLRLQRDDSGGLDADSLICLLLFDFSGTQGEVVTELDRFAWSQPVLCGPLGLRDIHVCKVGADALQDVIGASATMAGAWSLHGTPHNPQIVPFAPQGAELFHAPFSGSAYTPPLADPLAVAADFDNDGQSDVAIVSSNREECFVLARSFQSTGFGANPAVPVTMTGVLDGYNLTFGISVATGWVDEPTHAVFEVWLRDQPPSYVQPGPWLSDTVEIDGDGSHPITLTGNLPTGFDAGTGAFYLRAYVKHVGTTTQRTPATFWVHSFSQGTLRYILCSESDPYEPEGLCPPDDGPLIQGFNRRASVRPFEAGISPYGNNTQIPP